MHHYLYFLLSFIMNIIVIIIIIVNIIYIISNKIIIFIILSCVRVLDLLFIEEKLNRLKNHFVKGATRVLCQIPRQADANDH